jgi:hypothetical protein
VWVSIWATKSLAVFRPVGRAFGRCRKRPVVYASGCLIEMSSSENIRDVPSTATDPVVIDLEELPPSDSQAQDHPNGGTLSSKRQRTEHWDGKGKGKATDIFASQDDYIPMNTGSDKGEEPYETEEIALISLTPHIRGLIEQQQPEIYQTDISQDTIDGYELRNVFALRGDDGPKEAVHHIMRYSGNYKALLYCETGGPDCSFFMGKSDIDDRKESESRAYFKLHTQYPSVELRIPEDEGKTFSKLDRPACLHIFPENVAWKGEGDQRTLDMELLLGDQLAATVPDAMPKTKDRSKKNNFFAVRIGLDQSRVLPVSGVMQAELTFIRDLWSGAGPDPMLGTYYRDSLIGLAENGTAITIYCLTPKPLPNGVCPETGRTIRQVIEEWFRYLRLLFTVTKLRGIGWFYNLQAETTSSHADTAIPRWLVTHWKVKKTYVNGRIVYKDPKPSKWKSFDMVEVMPHHLEALEFYKLGLERQTQYQTTKLLSFLQSSETVSLTATFEPMNDETETGSRVNYAVFVYVRNLEEFHAADLTIPAIDTRIYLITNDGDEFRGVVQPNPFENNASFACVMKGPRQAKLNPSTPYPIHLTTVDDRLPNERRLAGLTNLASINPKNKPDGFDQLAILFGEQTPAPQPNALMQTTTPAQLAEFTAIIQARGANDIQEEFSIKTTQSVAGVEILHGPPGTGKTETVVGVAAAHASMNPTGGTLKPTRQVLFTSRQNVPVVQAISSFARWQRETLACKVDEHEFVLFSGAASSISSTEAMKARQNAASRAANETTRTDRINPWGDDAGQDPETAARLAEEVELRECLNNMLREHNARRTDPDYRHTYGYKLERRIAVWSTMGNHEMSPYTQRYMHYHREIGYTRGDAQRKMRNNLTVLEEKLGRYYLEHEVKVVFCTNSMSCHPTLMEAYRPVVLIVDEAAHTTLPDIVTPMAAFGAPRGSEEPGSLLQLILAGDDKQGKPINLGSAQNEAHHMMRMGLFRTLRENILKTHGSTMLTVCYRMVMPLLSYVSRAFYKNQLVAHPSAETQQIALQNTVKAYIASIYGDVAWNGRPRLAHDVSGPNVRYELFPGSFSRYNTSEAQRLVAYVLGLLTYSCPPKGRTVQNKDIGIITAYTGQALHIHDLLLQEDRRRRDGGRTHLDLGSIEVTTVAQAQGRQWPIVLFSFVVSVGKRYPDPYETFSCGFVGEPGNMCVYTSRAQIHLSFFGDFRALVQCTVSQHRCMTRNDNLIAFMRDLYKAGDILSVADWEAHILTGQPPTEAGSFLAQIDKKLDLRPAYERKDVDVPAEGSLSYTQQGAFGHLQGQSQQFHTNPTSRGGRGGGRGGRGNRGRGYRGRGYRGDSGGRGGLGRLGGRGGQGSDSRGH